MTRRLAGWDYRQRAIYMITVTLEDRRGEPLGKLAKNGEGYIAPTPFGEAVLEALAEMPRIAPQVEIIAVQLMPDHIHFIVFVKALLARPLGSLVRGFKAGAAKRWKLLAENGESQGYIAKNGESQNCPSSVPGHFCAGGFVPGHFCADGSMPAHFCAGGSVPAHSCAGLRWAEGFQDTVLLHEGQLKAMIAYLRDNPRRLAEKRANPALFRRVERIELPLDGGRLTGSFEALGNRHLLERPLAQVQCSRRFFAYRREAKRGGGMKIARTPDGEPIIESESPEYRERQESALAAAEHGAVVLSPCISDGERQIAREAMKRRLPLVALKNMGFAKLEKPAGRYFDACAEGRLLLLAPAAWPYTTQEKPMTRFDATALNRIAQWLAGGSVPGHSCSVPGHSCPGLPVEINYHGMKPANIDELAEKAVLARKGGAA
ncbi:MAG: hypothetical protein IJ146_09325 [Kiritimatiellae bacterium]|nr:hypothetical protein [Kiritimatiellia bacterium]